MIGNLKPVMRRYSKWKSNNISSNFIIYRAFANVYSFSHYYYGMDQSLQCYLQGKMYQINLCSPFWDHTPTSNFNIKLIRILLLTVLMLLYLMYLIIHLILKKAVNNLKSEDGQRLYEKQSFKQNWERQYMLAFGDHVIAVGFVICFSPYQFQILLSFLFFACRLGYEIMMQKFGISLKILKTILRVINLGMLICAIVGLSRTRYDDDLKNCRDRDYRTLV